MRHQKRSVESRWKRHYDALICRFIVRWARVDSASYKGSRVWVEDTRHHFQRSISSLQRLTLADGSTNHHYHHLVDTGRLVPRRSIFGFKTLTSVSAIGAGPWCSADFPCSDGTRNRFNLTATSDLVFNHRRAETIALSHIRLHRTSSLVIDRR